MNQSQKGLAQLLISRRHTAKWFEVIEEPCHLLAERVEGFLSGERGSPIALGRSHRHEVMRDELRSDALAVLPLVPHRLGQRMLRRHLRAHGLQDRTLRTVPRRADEGDARACIAPAGRDGGGPAAPRAAQSLCGWAAVFLNAPAACCWARTIVASRQSWRVRGQASVWSRSQSGRPRPRRSPRRKRLETASQCPNASGRSRQGVPGRARESTAAMPIRSLSPGGLPARDVRAVRMGAISAHASAVSNKRPDLRFPLACRA
jgi:hypothetical protein